VIATASASAASGPAIVVPGSRRDTIACTCALSAPPVPTTAFLTSVGEYSPTGMPARAAHRSATPRAWPSFRVDCGFWFTKTSSTAAASGLCSAIVASSCSASRARRCASGNAGSVFSWPFATCESRLPSAWMIAQPVVPSPGSRPRILGKLLQLLVRHLLVAPDGLDVVVVVECVHQLQQLLRFVSAHLDLRRRPPRKLRALALAKQRLERLGDFVKVLDAAPDTVTVVIRLHVVGAGFDCRFQNLVRVTRARRIFDQPEPFEAVADTAARAEIAAILREYGANVGRRPVAVVGQSLDNQGDAARTEALVADLFVIFGVAGRSLVDRPLNIVLRHRLGA